jgi:signal transduction histidine kinase
LQAPPTPPDEEERLRDLVCLQILDTPPEPRFDRITRVAQHLFRVPIATIALIDRRRQWLKSKQGVEGREIPRSISFCGHAILQDDVFVVENAVADARFADNPLVTSHPSIRFYAGAPLSGPSGRRIGTLCVIDSVPRSISAADKAALVDLARWAESELANVGLTEAVSALEAEVARKREFVTTVAHEVRTPLTSIRAALGLVAANERLSAGSTEREMLEIASRNTARLSRVLDDFLELDNLDSGHIPIRAERHVLPALVASAIAAERDRAAAAGVELKGICAAAEAVIHVDSEQLLRCLSRVLSNAIKFSSRGQKVEVIAESTPSAARIAIRDHGPGIPASYMSRLFRPFAQADAGDSRSQGGAGLGLAITKQLVEKMGGSIAVHCPQEGGTRVTLEFPLLTEEYRLQAGIIEEAAQPDGS